MRTRQLPWILGLGAMIATAAGWLMPRRHKSTAERIMDWSRASMRGAAGGWMKSGRGMIKRMLR